jgi:hypothetical protein
MHDTGVFESRGSRHCTTKVAVMVTFIATAMLRTTARVTEPPTI